MWNMNYLILGNKDTYVHSKNCKEILHWKIITDYALVEDDTFF